MSEAERYEPEVGQFLYGVATGTYDCPEYVGAFVLHLLREIERVFWNREQREWDRCEDPRIPGIVFNRYYWGECDCGFAERWEPKDEAWCAENGHAETCYQHDLKVEMDAWDAEHGYAALEAAAFGGEGVSLLGAFDGETEHPAPGVVVWSGTPRRDPAMQAWSKAHDARRRYEDGVYRRLAKKHGVDPRHGAAVHCTCDYARLREEWCATDDHSPQCGTVRPNLAFGGAEIRWYKHPGRGMSVNVSWTERQWRFWLNEGMRLIRAAEPPLPGAAN